MSTIALILGALLWTDTASAKKGASDGADWNPEASKALETKVRDTMTAMDAGNMDAMMGWADDETVVVYDMNEKGLPVSMYTRADAQKLMDGYATMMKEGAKMKSTITKIDCHSTTMFGFCVFEFDQSMMMNDMKMPDARFRATLIARNKGGSWRWTHWHASSRDAPDKMMMVEPSMKP